ncbi:hypothetical protein GP486_006718 [Trichoglossum hirsutum]|uniref:Ankyrin repeat protein n=1 Tax=Trichoglossum hirsutum TaxID=265104 RepID=A0A9P8IGS4_9PEZI|nr:hypothetical protein GP486_006718 [Trichoglossum hirsutum]
MTDKNSAKPSTRGFIKNVFGKRDSLRSPNPFRLSRPRSPPPRLKLNNESVQGSDNAQLTSASFNSSAAPLGVETGGDANVCQHDSRDIEPYRNRDALGNDGKDTEAADLEAHPVDMWAMADNQLRGDPQKCEMMQKYDRLLESKLPPGSKLEPIGTEERRKQAFGFFGSEIERLNAIDTTSYSQLKKCGNKAKRCFKAAVTCIMATRDIVNAAATPRLPASVACMGVTVLLSLCAQAADQRHILFEGLDSVSGSIHRIAEYEKLLWKQGNPELEDVKIAMTTACANIIEFQARATYFLGRNPVESAIRNAFKLDEWDNLLSAIERAESDVRGCAERKGWQEIQDIFAKFDDLRNDLKDNFKEVLAQQFANQEEKQRVIKRQEETADFLKLLLKNGCLYEDSKNRNSERVIGTCDWFTDNDQFKEWNLPSESQGSSLLYVTADPGCGKSVLSRYLIEEILPDDGRVVCYFFFKDDFKEQKSSLRALCSLLHQLFVSNRTLLTDDIIGKYEVQGAKFVESFAGMWSTFIGVASQQDTVCVIDALDECREPDRDQLIKAITEVCNRPTRNYKLKFLLTSRPYERIRRALGRWFNPQTSWIHLQGDSGPTADKIAEEIGIVVKSRIEEVARGYSLKPEEREFMEEQMKAIKNRTYLWAHLVFDGLMESETQFRLKKKDIMDLTKTLPKGADGVYERILSKSPCPNEARRILHIILSAKRPLSLAEMSVALAFGDSNDQASGTSIADKIVSVDELEIHIRNLCGLFVTVVDNKVYLLHQTTREFLIRNGTEDANKSLTSSELSRDSCDMKEDINPVVWKHSMNPADSNSVLAEICISYLQSDFAKENASMFEYSSIYWATHYCQSAGTRRIAVAKMTRDLCMPSELRTQWTKIHNIHNAIPAAGSPLCLASALGLGEAVEMFLHRQDSAGIDLEDKVDSKDGVYGWTPLMWAAWYGHETVVKLLLETGRADVDWKDNGHGQTPLSFATKNGHDAVVKLLLETGKADVNSKNSFGQTPLSLAAENGDKAMVKLLLETGKANVNSKDYRYGRAPLSWAAGYGREAVVKLLLETGKADVDSKDNVYGQTSLSWAAEFGHEAVVKLLLETGEADIDLESISGQTPLSLAIENGHGAVVKLLQSFGSS